MADPAQNGNVVALADAIASYLNGLQVAPDPVGTWANPFVLAFTATRQFYALDDLTALKLGDPPLVLLFPADDSEERLGGGLTSPKIAGDYAVDCVIYSQVGRQASSESACAKLLALRQQIRNTLWHVELTVTDQGGLAHKAVLAGVDGNPPYGQKSLMDKHVLVSAQTFRFSMPLRG